MLKSAILFTINIELKDVLTHAICRKLDLNVSYLVTCFMLSGHYHHYLEMSSDNVFTFSIFTTGPGSSCLKYSL